MKRLLLIALLLFGAFAQGQNLLVNPRVSFPPPVGIKQAVWNRNTGSTTLALTVNGVAKGSVVVVLVHKANQQVQASDVTDTVAAYTLDYGYSQNANVFIGSVSRRAAAAGNLTITIANSGASPSISACAYELTNCPTSNWFDAGAVAAATSASVAGAYLNTSCQGVILSMEVDGASSGTVTKTAGPNYAVSSAGAAHEDNAASFWSTAALDRTTKGALSVEASTLTLGSSQAWTYVSVAYGNKPSYRNFACLSDMELGADNIIVTPAAFNEGMRGGTGVWNTGPSAGQAITAVFRSGFNQTLKTGVRIGNEPCSTGAGNIGVGMHNETFEYIDYVFAAACSNVSVGFWFYPGMTNSADSTFYDAAMISGALDFCVMSVQMAGTSPTVPVKVHTQAGSSSGTINLTAKNWYWITLAYKAASGAFMRAYDSTGAQVGSEISLNVINFPAASFRIGENHAVSPPSPTVSYYDNIIVDEYHCVYPLGP